MSIISSAYRDLSKFFEKAKVTLPSGSEFLLMSLTPVAILWTIAPASFVSGWNEGRSGLLFAAFFVVLEWYDGRKEFHRRLDKRVLTIWLFAVSSLVLYYVAVFFMGLNDTIARTGVLLGLPEMPKMFSWVSMWEHLVFVSYLLAIFLSAYGASKLVRMITPVAYLIGMAIIFVLDAAFPYASLGPLQAVVHVIVPIDVSLLGLSGIKAIWHPESSRLFIFVTREGVQWFRGALDFFWPCVGVHSMIIFFMIITVLVAKIDAPRKRKVLYSATGALGTFSVNVFRIYLVSYYVATEGVARAKAFHESAGEILFMVWAVLFLLIVVKIEDLIYARQATKASAERTRVGKTLSLLSAHGDPHNET
nr:exosortase/archaeosortase family protein [Candidatus Njordarchaeum guaymaensis]